MYEQISLDSLEDKKFTSEEEVYSYISDLIEAKYNDSESLSLKENIHYFSICFFDAPKIRIKKVWEEFYLEFPDHFIDEIKNHNVDAKLMSSGYYRVSIPSIGFNDNLKSLIFEIYEYCYRKYSDDRFDCCSKYLECSDNKKCPYEGDSFARACSYHYTMTKKKKIFYGKNRNV